MVDTAGNAAIGVVHTVPGVRETSGGTARSVPGLCDALAEFGVRTTLVTQRIRNAPSQAILLPDASLVDIRLYEGYDWPGMRASFSPRMGKFLESVCRGAAPCVLHDHGIWLHANHVSARIAQALGIKRVVSPRGMLETWSMEYRRWKKRFAWKAYQQRDLQSASAFCSTSVREAESVRTLGLMQPIAVIPNGIDMPTAGARRSARDGDRRVVFMSRIHPKKGLLDLVHAWARSRLPGWRLVIAGPDEGGHRAEVERAVEAAGLRDQVDFIGPVEGDAKRELLANADLFVLPTYSENFGIVVGEALAHGTPVITTRAAPWEALHSQRCGWWIDNGAQPLAAALAEAMRLEDGAREDMGRRGREFVDATYSWHTVAERHAELYAWLLAKSDQPRWILA